MSSVGQTRNENKAIKFYCGVLAECAGDHGMTISSLKGHHSQAPAPVRDFFVQNGYAATNEEFRTFFQTHKETFAVIEDTVLLVTDCTTSNAVEFFHKVMEERHLLKGEFWISLQILSSYLSRSVEMQMYCNRMKLKWDTVPAFFQENKKFVVSGNMVALPEWFQAEVTKDAEAETLNFFLNLEVSDVKSCLINPNGANMCIEICELKDALHKVPLTVLKYLFSKYDASKCLDHFFADHPNYFEFVEGGNVRIRNKIIEEKALEYFCKFMEISDEYWHTVSALKVVLENAPSAILEYFNQKYGKDDFLYFFVQHEDDFVVEEPKVMLRSRLQEWETKLSAAIIKCIQTMMEEWHKLNEEFWISISSLHGRINPHMNELLHSIMKFKKLTFVYFLASHDIFLVSGKMVTLKSWFVSLPCEPSTVKKIPQFFACVLGTCLKNSSDRISVSYLEHHLWEAPNDVVAWLVRNNTDRDYVPVLNKLGSCYFEITKDGLIGLSKEGCQYVAAHFHEKVCADMRVKTGKSSWTKVKVPDLVRSFVEEVYENDSPCLLRNLLDKFFVKIQNNSPKVFVFLKLDNLTPLRPINQECQLKEAIQYSYSLLEKQHKSKCCYWVRILTLQGQLVRDPSPVQNFFQLICLDGKLTHFFAQYPEIFCTFSDSVALADHLERVSKETEADAITYFCSVIKECITKTASSRISMLEALEYLEEAPLHVQAHIKKTSSEIADICAFFHKHPSTFLVDGNSSLSLTKWDEMAQNMTRQFFQNLLMEMSNASTDEQGIHVDILKNRLMNEGSPVVKTYVKESYDQRFLEFFRENQGHFTVLGEKVSNCALGLQSKKLGKNVILFFQDILQRCNTLYQEHEVDISQLQGYLSEAPNEVKQYIHTCYPDQKIIEFFRSHKEFQVCKETKISLAKSPPNGTCNNSNSIEVAKELSLLDDDTLSSMIYDDDDDDKRFVSVAGKLVYDQKQVANTLEMSSGCKHAENSEIQENVIKDKLLSDVIMHKDVTSSLEATKEQAYTPVIYDQKDAGNDQLAECPSLSQLDDSDRNASEGPTISGDRNVLSLQETLSTLNDFGVSRSGLNHVLPYNSIRNGVSTELVIEKLIAVISTQDAQIKNLQEQVESLKAEVRNIRSSFFSSIDELRQQVGHL